MARRSPRWWISSLAPVIAGCASAAFAGCSDNGMPNNDVAGNDAAGDSTSHPDGTPGMDVTPGMDATPGMDVTPGMDAPAPDGPMPPMGSVPITQWGYDLGRTVANRRETALTVAAVMGGRLGRDTAFTPPSFDGDIYTQPLYLPALSVMGATHDVLFVSTQNNSVYAIDAATGAMLWRTGLGTPVSRGNQPCGNITPQTGIQGGAVIDPATSTLYAVAYTRTGGANVFTINALDVTTGMQRAGYPQPINPPASNGSTWSTPALGERGAITFVGGRVYVPFGGLYGDCGTYHGWVVGIDATMPTHQTSFATPGNGSGIWAPSGISSDGTNLYAATGNGFTTSSMGEYIIRLQTGASGPVFSTMATDYFTPSDRTTLDRGDVDIGSVGPVVLPDHTGSMTPHLLFEGGKAGVAYLINRDNLGGMGTGSGTSGEGVFSARISGGGHFGAGAAWSDGTNVYAFMSVSSTRQTPCTGTGGVVAVRLGTTGTGSNFSVAWCSASGSDGTSAISSNGNMDGILWVSYAGSPGRLRAYNISSGAEIFTDSMSPVRKWVPPVVADGRVFVTGANTVSMYRLLH